MYNLSPTRRKDQAHTNQRIAYKVPEKYSSKFQDYYAAKPELRPTVSFALDLLAGEEQHSIQG